MKGLTLCLSFLLAACSGPTATVSFTSKQNPLAKRYSVSQNKGETTLTTTDGEWVATFTKGSRTVTLKGPERILSERTAANSVTNSIWVRLLEHPFDGAIDYAWLEAARKSEEKDVLAVSMDYIEGVVEGYAENGLRVLGDASYGPLQSDGTRQEGSDFNDYLGLTWTYSTGKDSPEPHQYGSLDCSGYVRMVYGYRLGFPLTLTSNATELPRRAVQMYDSAPGAVVISNTGKQSQDFSLLRPGDLVFFDASTDDGTAIDHVGVYLGVDKAGEYRFISSRKSIDGPTLGDYRGKSVLNGTGLYAKAFRAARRL